MIHACVSSHDEDMDVHRRVNRWLKQHVIIIAYAAVTSHKLANSRWSERRHACEREKLIEWAAHLSKETGQQGVGGNVEGDSQAQVT
jgi:hypothetical protein